MTIDEIRERLKHGDYDPILDSPYALSKCFRDVAFLLARLETAEALLRELSWGSLPIETAKIAKYFSESGKAE